MARVGEFVGANGLGESDGEAKEYIYILQIFFLILKKEEEEGKRHCFSGFNGSSN